MPPPAVPLPSQLHLRGRFSMSAMEAAADAAAAPGYASAAAKVMEAAGGGDVPGRVWVGSAEAAAMREAAEDVTAAPVQAALAPDPAVRQPMDVLEERGGSSGGGGGSSTPAAGSAREVEERREAAELQAAIALPTMTRRMRYACMCMLRVTCMSCTCACYRPPSPRPSRRPATAAPARRPAPPPPLCLLRWWWWWWRARRAARPRLRSRRPRRLPTSVPWWARSRQRRCAPPLA